jgi:hypothetical protein
MGMLPIRQGLGGLAGKNQSEDVEYPQATFTPSICEGGERRPKDRRSKSMADIKRIEDTLNAALEASEQPLGGFVETDEDDLFADMLAEQADD